MLSASSGRDCKHTASTVALPRLARRYLSIGSTANKEGLFLCEALLARHVAWHNSGQGLG